MKAIWRGENDPLGLLEGKTYDISKVVWDGEMYSVVDETGEEFLYPAEDFEVIE